MSHTVPGDRAVVDEAAEKRDGWRILFVRAWFEVDGLRVEINEAGPAMRPRRRAVLRSGEEAGQELARALQELDRGGHAGNDSLTPSPTAPVDAPGPTQRGPR